MPWPAGDRVAGPKVTACLLNPRHPAGAAKCRFLTSSGFAPADPDALIDAIAAHPTDASLLDIQVGAFGLKDRYQAPLATPGGSAPVVCTIRQLGTGAADAHFAARKPER